MSYSIRFVRNVSHSEAKSWLYGICLFLLDLCHFSLPRSLHGDGMRNREVIVILGGMDAARVKPPTFAGVSASVSWPCRRRSGLHYVLGMGDDVWRGQKERSVARYLRREKHQLKSRSQHERSHCISNGHCLLMPFCIMGC